MIVVQLHEMPTASTSLTQESCVANPVSKEEAEAASTQAVTTTGAAATASDDAAAAAARVNWRCFKADATAATP